MLKQEVWSTMPRPQILAALRKVLDEQGLEEAFKDALVVTETLEESAEELLVDILQEIIDNVNETGTLFSYQE